MTLVLASSSRARIALLQNAGLDFEARPAPVDERLAEAPLLAAGAAPPAIATALAEAKALAVSALMPGPLVIGSDQVLDLDGERLTKPESLEEARDQLRRLAGRSHRLHSAAALAKDGATVWSTIESAELTMRPLSPEAIARHVERMGDAVLWTVGCYHLEDFGIQLFSKIEGDYFTILGLPLLPLLEALRRRGILAS